MRKCEREIKVEEKKNTALPQPPEQSAGGVNVSTATDGDHGFLHSDVKKKSETKLRDAPFIETHAVKCNELIILCIFC